MTMISFHRTWLSCLFACSVYFADAQNIYFPPLNNSSTWEKIDPGSLGWCIDNVDALYQFLENENTKGFIVLKDGRIVLEKYFGTFTQDSVWYWASAGKTITAFLIGQAQEAGLLKISDQSSQYLGKGWTHCTPLQEEKITIRHQLTMTSGLDDGVEDNHCLIDTCLIYKADAGSRWAYHNAPYTLLEKVLTEASGMAINTFTQVKLKNQTGITGAWFTVDYDNVFFSKVRSMARFGILIQNKGVWNKDTLLKNEQFFSQMINTSQNINLSYGYLWWLNGKPSYMVPGFQFFLPGPYAPSAPDDMVAGLGKNGQILSISPSKGIVIIRMGEKPNSSSSEIATVLCDQIWQKLNTVMCNTTSVDDVPVLSFKIVPNPAVSKIAFFGMKQPIKRCEIFNRSGQCVYNKTLQTDNINVSDLTDGLYYVRLTASNGHIYTAKFIKL
jgi:CubicO group peptidase (beta-lactamase class C family)